MMLAVIIAFTCGYLHVDCGLGSIVVELNLCFVCSFLSRLDINREDTIQFKCGGEINKYTLGRCMK